MSGHAFIVRGDLTRLACDGWLVPCDGLVHIMGHWLAALSAACPGWKRPARTPAWLRGEARVLAVPGWPSDLPRPWLAATAGDTPECMVAAVREFLEVAAGHAWRTRVLERRAKPLLALPLVGTGAGGGAAWAGDVVAALLPVMLEGAQAYDVDVALVTADGPAHSAAHHERAKLEESGREVWPDELSQTQRRSAAELARHARDRQLVLFLGAGLGVGAGLPTWGELLGTLAELAGIGAAGSQAAGELPEAFRSLGNLDQASLISDRLAQRGKSVAEEVARIVGARPRYSLSHALLAGLPVGEAVTTNYDTLFEAASAAAGRVPAVLPYEAAQAGHRWLLKLHGCVDHPQDIVLTRSDYLRYNERRAALQGIVQALLITRHMLFVGFSLTDENFHRVIHDVRNAVRGTTGRAIHAAGAVQADAAPFGTALALQHNELFQELWRDDVGWVTFDGGESSAAGEEAAAAWRLEVFLDYLAAQASDRTAHLLDPRYGGVLGPESVALRDALLAFLGGATAEMRRSGAWSEVEELVGRLGGAGVGLR